MLRRHSFRKTGNRFRDASHDVGLEHLIGMKYAQGLSAVSLIFGPSIIRIMAEHGRPARVIQTGRCVLEAAGRALQHRIGADGRHEVVLSQPLRPVALPQRQIHSLLSRTGASFSIESIGRDFFVTLEPGRFPWSFGRNVLQGKRASMRSATPFANIFPAQTPSVRGPPLPWKRKRET
jgi:hypothetical protein